MDGDAAAQPGFAPGDALAVITRMRRGVAVLAPDDTIIAANDAFIETVEEDRETLATRPIWELLPGVEESELGRAVREARATGHPVVADAYLPSYGSWIELNVNPQRDRLVVIVEDRTPLKRLEHVRALHHAIDAVEPGDSFDDDLRAIIAAVRDTIGYAVGEAWVCPDAAVQEMRLRVWATEDDARWQPFVEQSLTLVLPTTGVDPEEVDERGVVRVRDIPGHEAFNDAHPGEERIRGLFRIPVDVGDGVQIRLSFLTTRGLDADPWCEIVAEQADVVRSRLRDRWAQHELRRFMDVSQELLWTVDADMRVRRVNLRLLTEFGYEAAEIVGRRFTDFLPDADPEEFERAFTAFLDRGGETDGFELTVLDRAGAKRITTWRARANPHERLVYAAGRDVTNERREIRRREWRNEVLVGVASSAPIETTLDRLARSVEDELGGVRVAVMTYDADHDTLRAVAGPSLPAEYNAAMQDIPIGPASGSCGTAVWEMRLVVAHDIATDERWVTWRDIALAAGVRSCWSVPVVDSAGLPIGSLAMYRDVPSTPTDDELRALSDAVQLASIAIERSRTEQQLALSRERLRLLADATTDAMFDWDVQGDRIWCSESRSVFGAIAGTHRESLAFAREHIHLDDGDDALAAIHRLVGGEDTEFEAVFRFRGDDGAIADAEVTGTIVRDATGRAVRVVGGVTDISQQRQLERQRLRSQRMESIGNLASGIAHDLNNTLAPILMAIDVLRSRPLDDDVRSTIDLIDTSVRRGADMVRQVLSFARGQEGDRVDIEPARLVRDLERFVRDSFPKSVVLRTVVEPGLEIVKGDPTQLHQVLLNLAVNARDAMPDGGELTITAGHGDVTSGDTANDRGLAPGRYVVLRVRDTGVGIGAADREHLFEPFFSTKPPTLGTGLGLSTSLAIVQRHGGTITVASIIGHGAEFTVYLPAVARTGSRPHAELTASGARGAGERVLLVDDEVRLRDVTTQVLTDHGYRVAEASNGAEALEVIDTAGVVDVVVTDLAMPVMDGNALVRELQVRSPGTPVIVVSGLLDGSETEELLAAGAAAVLTKPFPADVLLRTIEQALERSPS